MTISENTPTKKSKATRRKNKHTAKNDILCTYLKTSMTIISFHTDKGKPEPYKE